MSQVAGRQSSLTFTTALRPGGRCWVRALFWAARHVPAVAAPLVPLDVIHYLRWTLLDRLPGRDLEAPVLLFESDFDRDVEAYIETFAEVVPWRMSAVWATAYGYPKLIPNAPFHAWVTSHEAKPGHFYTAFPSATCGGIGAALQLADAFERFSNQSGGLDDTAFAHAYRQFLGEVQAWL